MRRTFHLRAAGVSCAGGAFIVEDLELRIGSNQESNKESNQESNGQSRAAGTLGNL